MGAVRSMLVGIPIMHVDYVVYAEPDFDQFHFPGLHSRPALFLARAVSEVQSSWRLP